MLRLYLLARAVGTIARSIPAFLTETGIGPRGLGYTNSTDYWSSSLPHCASFPDLGLRRRQELNPWSNSDLTANIGSASGCPQSRRTAYVGVAADCAYRANFDSDDDARQHITDVVKTASVVFENSFNVSIELQDITLSDPNCPASGSDDTPWNAACTDGDINSRLQDFSSWRRSISDSNAYWTLFTGCSSSSGEVGVSWVGALCQSGGSSDPGVNVVAQTQLEWQVFAHESAHTFGATHDCTSETCSTQSSHCCPLSSDTCDADGQYIMDPVSRTGMTRFSPCTIGTVCSRMGSGRINSRCLQSRNGDQDTERCGNGVVETGEACDCGNGACNYRDRDCCDSSTCQWKSGGQCGSGNGLDSGTDDNSSSWAREHLRLVISLAAGIGGAFILLIFALILIRCWGNKKKKAVDEKPENREAET